MNIEPMSSGADLPTDAEVDHIHDAVFVVQFGLPTWQTRHFVGIILLLVKKARSSGQSDSVTRPAVIAIMDQLAVNVVLTSGEQENWEAIKQRMVASAFGD